MKLFLRSILGSLGSALSPKKGKDQDAGNDHSAPSLPPVGKDTPNDHSAPSVPAVGKDIPTPSITGVNKDIPTPSAAVPAKDTAAAPSAADADSIKNISPSPSTITTTITVSDTDTKTVTSAETTVTIIQHDLATVATTLPTTLTALHHDLATVATTIPTTILTTKIITAPISTKQNAAAQSTAPLLPAVSAVPSAKKHIEPAVVLSILFGLAIMGLLGVISFLMMKLRRVTKAKATVGAKTYAEEFDWPQPRAVEMDDVGRKDEWGPKQKEAWGVK